MIRRLALHLLVVLAFSACASGGRGGTALYRRDIGTATLHDAVSVSMQIINRYGYEVFETDSMTHVRILTHWKQRRPFEDETALGINAAESRMLVMARQRSQSEMGSVYAITVTIENRVRLGNSPDWNESASTGMFRAWADDLTNEYRKLITNIGVRRYN